MFYSWFRETQRQKEFCNSESTGNGSILMPLSYTSSRNHVRQGLFYGSNRVYQKTKQNVREFIFRGPQGKSGIFCPENVEKPTPKEIEGCHALNTTNDWLWKKGGLNWPHSWGQYGRDGFSPIKARHRTESD